MGYGQKVKKWFFDEDGDEVEEYEDVCKSEGRSK